ncbi:MAG TPA: hypothetical protein VN972_05160 [Methylomirabilota bacterium]|nr:hypothetical protein [Methylomirabilota bacterium]
MNATRRATALAALVSAGLLLAGCERSPLGPGDSAQSVSMAPPVVAFTPDGTVDYVWAPIDTVEVEPESIGTASLPPRSLSASVRIDGSRGGMVRAGRFSVKIPAGAVSGTATVTLTMPDSTVMVCDLSIAPSSANAFNVPVQLTADLSSTDLPDASSLTMYWYDPIRVTWVNCASKSRTMGTQITMNLEHFSRYAAGKAGW